MPIKIPKSLWPSACATSLSTGSHCPLPPPPAVHLCVCVYAPPCVCVCVLVGDPIQLEHLRGGFDYGALREKNLFCLAAYCLQWKDAQGDISPDDIQTDANPARGVTYMTRL